MMVLWQALVQKVLQAADCWKLREYAQGVLICLLILILEDSPANSPKTGYRARMDFGLAHRDMFVYIASSPREQRRHQDIGYAH